jgi:hypothetical protein
MFRGKRRIINDDDKGSSFVRKRDIRTALHGVHPKKQRSSVLAVFVNGLMSFKNTGIIIIRDMNLLYWERLYKNMCYALFYIKPLAIQIVTPSIEPVKSTCNRRNTGL